MDKKLFDEFKESLQQMVDHTAGKRHDLRTTTLPRPPKALSQKEIAGIRSKMNVSQAVFARMLNISVKTIQAWEQGTGRPSGASLKLLSIARTNPKALMTA